MQCVRTWVDGQAHCVRTSWMGETLNASNVQINSPNRDCKSQLCNGSRYSHVLHATRAQLVGGSYDTTSLTLDWLDSDCGRTDATKTEAYI